MTISHASLVSKHTQERNAANEAHAADVQHRRNAIAKVEDKHRADTAAAEAAHASEVHDRECRVFAESHGALKPAIAVAINSGLRADAAAFLEVARAQDAQSHHLVGHGLATERFVFAALDARADSDETWVTVAANPYLWTCVALNEARSALGKAIAFGEIAPIVDALHALDRGVAEAGRRDARRAPTPRDRERWQLLLGSTSKDVAKFDGHREPVAQPGPQGVIGEWRKVGVEGSEPSGESRRPRMHEGGTIQRETSADEVLAAMVATRRIDSPSLV